MQIAVHTWHAYVCTCHLPGYFISAYVFVIITTSCKVLVGSSLLFPKYMQENVVHDINEVLVFIMHRVDNSKKTTLVLPSGCPSRLAGAQEAQSPRIARRDVVVEC
ncbi:hypothetical protein Vretifemale_16038 [Volvox reticuliferus]|uniref:Uncharacterized protein n=1 Tax=Volvox reticuliferus TaxID=1737510 RepID=A0A8J4CMX0_9CHLO|nr:hypothetical protein Vretifemale_11867 [Volvox reticuliferus]GIL88001.1 hypothetical protein Vretifemale_16038 [Volvox reticuliferus]